MVRLGSLFPQTAIRPRHALPSCRSMIPPVGWRRVSLSKFANFGNFKTYGGMVHCVVPLDCPTERPPLGSLSAAASVARHRHRSLGDVRAAREVGDRTPVASGGLLRRAVAVQGMEPRLWLLRRGRPLLEARALRVQTMSGSVQATAWYRNARLVQQRSFRGFRARCRSPPHSRNAKVLTMPTPPPSPTGPSRVRRSRRCLRASSRHRSGRHRCRQPRVYNL